MLKDGTSSLATLNKHTESRTFEELDYFRSNQPRILPKTKEFQEYLFIKIEQLFAFTNQMGLNTYLQKISNIYNESYINCQNSKVCSGVKLFHLCCYIISMCGSIDEKRVNNRRRWEIVTRRICRNHCMQRWCWLCVEPSGICALQLYSRIWRKKR